MKVRIRDQKDPNSNVVNLAPVRTKMGKLKRKCAILTLINITLFTKILYDSKFWQNL